MVKNGNRQRKIDVNSDVAFLLIRDTKATFLPEYSVTLIYVNGVVTILREYGHDKPPRGTL